MNILVRLPFIKSKEEKEQERRLRLRQTQTKVNRYVKQAQQLRIEYEKNAIEARRIENNALTKRFAAKMLIIDHRIKAMETYRLVLNDFELTKQQGNILSDMALTIKDFTDVFRGESLSAKESTQITSNLDKIFEFTQKADFNLNSVIDNMNDKMLEVGFVDDAEVETILRSIDQKAEAQESRSLPTFERIRSPSEVQLSSNPPSVNPVPKPVPTNPDYNELDKRIEKGLKDINKNKRKQG